MPESLRDIYLLRVKLRDINPPISRSIRVQSNIDLWQFHMILQISIGWTNSHLHEFIYDGKRYGSPDPEFGGDIIDEQRIRLRKLLKKPGEKLLYLYDFGDGWEHDIVLEEILPYSHDSAFPACLAAENNCPPEDVGGPGGYQDFLEALADPAHPEHTNMIEWAGSDFDPKSFDISEVNEFLKSWERSA